MKKDLLVTLSISLHFCLNWEFELCLIILATASAIVEARQSSWWMQSVRQWEYGVSKLNCAILRPSNVFHSCRAVCWAQSVWPAWTSSAGTAAESPISSPWAHRRAPVAGSTATTTSLNCCSSIAGLLQEDKQKKSEISAHPRSPLNSGWVWRLLTIAQLIIATWYHYIEPCKKGRSLGSSLSTKFFILFTPSDESWRCWGGVSERPKVSQSARPDSDRGVRDPALDTCNPQDQTHRPGDHGVLINLHSDSDVYL